MTLTKPKPRRLTPEHRKRLGHHHHQSHHYMKTYWPYLPMVAIFTFGLFVNSWLGQTHRSVLGYATDISIQELLDGTNVQRNDNGEGNLTINAALNQAAQAKANDMAARDYWSHNTPDGQTPWTFITAAGYDYQTAGENLAYGFASAGDTITGWMNSPEHRANILNTSYRDVGFGFINIANYQNSGPETLVVAMYGSLSGAAVAAATPAPAAPRSPVSKPTPTPAPVTSVAPIAAQPPAPLAITKQTPPPVPAKSATLTPPQPAEQHISRFQLVAANAPLSSAVLTMFALAGLMFIIVRHGFAWHRFLRRGERFVIRHPALDMAAVSLLTLCVILTQTIGVIR